MGIIFSFGTREFAKFLRGRRQCLTKQPHPHPPLTTLFVLGSDEKANNEQPISKLNTGYLFYRQVLEILKHKFKNFLEVPMMLSFVKPLPTEQS
jgi:hypothetical protein